MLSRAIFFNKSLIRFVLVRTLLLAIAFSAGFNLVLATELISVPGATREFFMHNWGYLLLSYTLLVYGMGLLSLLAKSGVQIGFRGMVWITVFHAMGALLFL